MGDLQQDTVRSANLAILMTCHNRRDSTLACLESLFLQQNLAWRLTVILVDDGSTDGTTEAIKARFPAVEVQAGDGNLYWAGGMRAATKTAERYDPDFYLWLNDDVVLDPGAIAGLLETYREVVASQGLAIVVGATRDPTTAHLTYSGVRRGRLNPTKFQRITPDVRPIEAETMNGNIVLVPVEVARRLPMFDSAFPHSMADFDFGLRARAFGIPTWIASGTLGTCSRNLGARPWDKPPLGIRERFKVLGSPLGLPPRAWATFTRRHAGPFWPVFWLSPYARALFRRKR